MKNNTNTIDLLSILETYLLKINKKNLFAKIDYPNIKKCTIKEDNICNEYSDIINVLNKLQSK